MAEAGSLVGVAVCCVSLIRDRYIIYVRDVYNGSDWID
jgi:hypothetical protein